MFPGVENHTFYQDLPDYDNPDHPYRVRLDSTRLTELGRYVYGLLQIGA